MDPISESEELRVSFYPELFLQRRVWVLNILRREGITQVSVSVLFVLRKAIHDLNPGP